jgi:hypothetical protein
MFLHLLDQTIWYGIVIYTKQGGTKTQLQFRLDLLEQIIEKYGKIQPRSGRPSSTPSPLRLIGRHFMEEIPPTDSKERPTVQSMSLTEERKWKENMQRDKILLSGLWCRIMYRMFQNIPHPKNLLNYFH